MLDLSTVKKIHTSQIPRCSRPLILPHNRACVIGSGNHILSHSLSSKTSTWALTKFFGKAANWILYSMGYSFFGPNCKKLAPKPAISPSLPSYVSYTLPYSGSGKSTFAILGSLPSPSPFVNYKLKNKLVISSYMFIFFALSNYL